MKYADIMDERDRSDLERAALLVVEGKVLRKRVFGRLRSRALRHKRKGEVQSGASAHVPGGNENG